MSKTDDRQIGDQAPALVDTAMQRAISRLPLRERIAFEMRTAGSSSTAIAARLKVSRVTAHLLATRAAQKVKSYLKWEARRDRRRPGWPGRRRETTREIQSGAESVTSKDAGGKDGDFDGDLDAANDPDRSEPQQPGQPFG